MFLQEARRQSFHHAHLPTLCGNTFSFSPVISNISLSQVILYSSGTNRYVCTPSQSNGVSLKWPDGFIIIL